MKLFSLSLAEIQKPTRMEGKGNVSAQETPTSAVELGNPWQTVLFNDEVHSFDQVILQIQKATGYSLERAVNITPGFTIKVKL